MKKAERPNSYQFPGFEPEWIKSSQKKGYGYTVVIDDKGMKWRKYSFPIRNSQEEEILRESAGWRLSTSMPILRANSLQIQPQERYPKYGTILIEHLVRDLNMLNNLSIQSALYVLKQSLLGFHTLMYKYGKVTISKENYGLNCRGECRVWIGEELVFPKTENPTLTVIWKVADVVLDHIMKITKTNQKRVLIQLKHILKRKEKWTYYSIYEEIEEIIKDKNLNIPLSVFITPIKERKQLIATPVRLIKSPPSISFEYKSPKLGGQNPEIKTIFSTTNSRRYTFFSKQKQNSHNYRNSQHDISRFRNKVLAVDNIERSKSKNNQPKSVSKRKISPSKKKEKIKLQEFIISPICIPSTLSINSQFQHTFRPISNKNNEKNSQTTQFTQQKNESSIKSSKKRINSERQHEKKLEAGRNVVSIVIQSKNNENTQSLSHKYNFGGVLKLNDQNEKQIIHMEAKTARNLPTNEEKYPITESHLTKSVFRSPLKVSNIPKDIFQQNSWQRKYKGLLLDNQGDENIKQSICYGEEKESVLNARKLEMLGHMGRQIDKSIIPQ